MVLNRSPTPDQIAVYKITNGSWGSALASANATILDNTAYTIKIARKQGSITVQKVGQSTANFTYDPSTDFGVGQAGLFSDKTGVTFDDFKVHLGYSHDPLTPRTSGLPQTSVTAGKLEVQGGLGGRHLARLAAFVSAPSARGAADCHRNGPDPGTSKSVALVALARLTRRPGAATLDPSRQGSRGLRSGRFSRHREFRWHFC